MGAVYVAEHLLLGRKVAIKRLHPELAGDEKAVARFQREARAAAATGHEHIVEVLDLGYAEDGAPYLVMEYLRGASLSQVLKQEGRLSPTRTAQIVGQVLAALRAVHDRGIVHRDLKPDNVFLTRRGALTDYVKVLDFGISKMRHEEGEPSKLTRTGVTMGTPHYMSPEQARGVRNLDHRVDLYAVAVITYECLTGRLPLVGDNYHALLQQILRVEPAPPSSLVPGLPPELDAVVLRGLAKDPSLRYATAAEMLEALVPFGATRASQSTSPADVQAVASIGHPSGVDVGAPTEAIGEASRSEARRAGGSSPDLKAVRLSSPPAGSFDPRASGSARRSNPSLPRLGSDVEDARAVVGALAVGDAGASRLEPARPSEGSGPRYFRATSDDWQDAEPGRRRFESGPMPSAAKASGVGLVQASAARAPVRTNRSDRSSAALEHPPALVREAPTNRSSREEPCVRGAIVAGLFEHVERTLGTPRTSALVTGLPTAIRDKLDGVILPMAWLPCAVFVALLRALASDATPGAVEAAGRAVAERELSTTHRLFVETASPVTVVERIPHLHRTYFSYGEVTASNIPGGARLQLDGFGSDGEMVAAWLAGFWQRAFELVGARDVRSAVASRAEDRGSITFRWR